MLNLEYGMKFFFHKLKIKKKKTPRILKKIIMETQHHNIKDTRALLFLMECYTIMRTTSLLHL